MKSFFLFIAVFFTFAPLAVAALPAQVDSILTLDPFEQELIVRRIMKQYYFGPDAQTSPRIERQKHVLEEASKTGSAETVLKAQIALGDAYYHHGKYTKAYHEYFKALEALEGKPDSNNLGLVMLKIAGVHYQAHYAQNDDYFEKGMKLLEHSTDKQLKALYCYSKAKIDPYSAVGKNWVIKAYNLQLEVLREKPDDFVTQEDMTKFLNVMGRHDDAIALAKKIGSTYYLIYYLNNAGENARAAGNYQKALTYFFESYEICKKERLSALLRNTFGNICKAYINAGNLAKALQYQKLQLLSEECAYEERYEAQYTEYKVRYLTEEKEKGLKLMQEKNNALAMQVKLESLQRNFLLAGIFVLVLFVGYMYMSRKKIHAINKHIEEEKNHVLTQKRELDFLHAELLRNEQKLKQAQHIAKLAHWELDPSTGTFSFSDDLPLLVGSSREELGTGLHRILLDMVDPQDRMIAGRLFDTDANSERANSVIRVYKNAQLTWLQIVVSRVPENENHPALLVGTIQDVSAEKAEEAMKIRIAEQQSFTLQLLQSQEEERKRIAHELHDGLGQDILLLRNAAQLGIYNKSINDAGKEQLENINSIAASLLQTVRDISFDLIPVHLSRVGLTEVLRESIQKVKESSGLQINAFVDNVDGLFSQTNELHVFRIIQECLSNVIKHADARSVEVHVQKSGSQLTISISDDGVGFQPQTVEQKTRGFGMGSLHNRVSVLKGVLHISSESGKGSKITITIPIEIR